MRLLPSVLLLLVAAACGDGGGGSTDAAPGSDAPALPDGAPGADAPSADADGIDGGVAAPDALYYWGDFETNGELQVARVDLSTDERTILSLSGLDAPTRIDLVAVSPDGQEIAVGGRYLDSAQTTFTLNLYAADGSGAPTVLASGTRGNENMRQATFSPDGTRLAFVVDLEENNAHALYVAPADGSGAPTAVSHAPAAGKEVRRFLWADDSHIVFAGDTVTDNVTGVYAVDVTAATPEPVDLIPMNQLADGREADDLLGLDASGRVYFVSDHQVDDLFRLHRVDLDGQNLVRVPGTAIDDENQAEAPVGTFAVSADGQTLAFTAAAPDPSLFEVYALDLSGSTPVQVSGVGAAAPASGTTGPSDREPLDFSSDGSKLAMASDWQLVVGDQQSTFAAFVLPSSQPAGGARLVAPDDVTSGDVTQLAFTPSGSRLVVLGDLVDDNDFELYLLGDLATAEQGPATVLFEDVPASGDVGGFALSR